MTGTPEQLNWGYDLCMGQMKEHNDVGVIHASTRANTTLPKDYADKLVASHTAKAVKAYVDGQFINLSEGLVYYGFDPLVNVKEMERPETAELGVGMDFNVNPMAAAVFWRSGEHMHYFKEYELPNADTQYACDVLKDNHKGLVDVYPDATGIARKTASPAGKSDFHYIQEAGLTVWAHSTNPHRRDRYNSTNGKLAPKKGPVTLTVDPSCKSLIKYFSLYSFEQLNAQKSMSHLLDAATYPVHYLFPVSKDTLEQHKLIGV